MELLEPFKRRGVFTSAVTEDEISSALRLLKRRGFKKREVSSPEGAHQRAAPYGLDDVKPMSWSSSRPPHDVAIGGVASKGVAPDSTTVASNCLRSTLCRCSKCVLDYEAVPRQPAASSLGSCSDSARETPVRLDAPRSVYEAVPTVLRIGAETSSSDIAICAAHAVAPAKAQYITTGYMRSASVAKTCDRALPRCKLDACFAAASHRMVGDAPGAQSVGDAASPGTIALKAAHASECAAFQVEAAAAPRSLTAEVVAGSTTDAAGKMSLATPPDTFAVSGCVPDCAERVAAATTSSSHMRRQSDMAFKQRHDAGEEGPEGHIISLAMQHGSRPALMAASRCVNATAVEAFLRRNGAFDNPTSAVASRHTTHAAGRPDSKTALPLLHPQPTSQQEACGCTSWARPILLDAAAPGHVMTQSRLELDQIRPGSAASPLDQVSPGSGEPEADKSCRVAARLPTRHELQPTAPPAFTSPILVHGSDWATVGIWHVPSQASGGAFRPMTPVQLPLPQAASAVSVASQTESLDDSVPDIRSITAMPYAMSPEHTGAKLSALINNVTLHGTVEAEGAWRGPIGYTAGGETTTSAPLHTVNVRTPDRAGGARSVRGTLSEIPAYRGRAAVRRAAAAKQRRDIVAQLAAGTLDVDGLVPTDLASHDDSITQLGALAHTMDAEPELRMPMLTASLSTGAARSSTVDTPPPMWPPAPPPACLCIASCTRLAVPPPVPPTVRASNEALRYAASMPGALRDHYVGITLMATGILLSLVDIVTEAAQADSMPASPELCSLVAEGSVVAAEGVAAAVGTSGSAWGSDGQSVNDESPIRSAPRVQVFEPVAGQAAQGQSTERQQQRDPSNREGKVSPAQLVREVAADATAAGEGKQVAANPLRPTPCRALVRPNVVAQSMRLGVAASPAQLPGTGPVANAQVHGEAILEYSSSESSSGNNGAMALPAKLSCHRQLPLVDLGISSSCGACAVRRNAPELIVSGQDHEVGASMGQGDQPDIAATAKESDGNCEAEPSPIASPAYSVFAKCAVWRSRDPKRPQEPHSQGDAQAVCDCCRATHYDGAPSGKSVWNLFGHV